MRMLTRSALIGLALAGSVSSAVAPAMAKDFYTRKRVNGHWVYGEFPKKGSQAEQAATSQTAAAQPAQAVATMPGVQPGQTSIAVPANSAPAPFGLGLHFAPQTQPSAKPTQSAETGAAADNLAPTTGSIREPRSHRYTWERRRHAHAQRHEAIREAAAKPEPRRVIEKSEPAPRAAPKPALREASADASVTPVAAASAAPTQAPEASKRLAEALAAKAGAMASGVIASPAQPIPQPKAEPVSVTYDYKTGIKTVTYANGGLDEEPFDPATMKGLATTAAR